MQTLFIPKKIKIEFLDAKGNPIHQDKILIGIKTIANHKNNISISPFLSDKNGIIIITAADIKNTVDNFISYGLMDYSSLESAKPEIEIIYWGTERLDRYINYWTELLENSTDLKQYEMWGDKLGKRERENAEIERRERQELELRTTCYNRTVKQKSDIAIIKDNWDKPNAELNYKVTFDLK